MADGEITIKLKHETLARLADNAAASGEDPQAWAAKALEEATERAYWAEAIARLDEFDRTGGETISVTDAFAELRRRVAQRRAKL